MSKVIRVRYEKGVLKLLEPIDPEKERMIGSSQLRRGVDGFSVNIKDILGRTRQEEIKELLAKTEWKLL